MTPWSFGVDGGGDPAGSDFELLEHGGDDAVLLFKQRVEEVGSLDFGVAAGAGVAGGGRDGFGGLYGEAVHVHGGFSGWRFL